MLDNYGVAIMNMVNDLAARHGIRPYEFVATLGANTGNAAEIELRFETPPRSGKSAAFEQMLRDLSVGDSGEDLPRLRGTEETIYASLESALRRAPKRGRSR